MTQAGIIARGTARQRSLLFSSCRLGEMALPNRIVMPPMSRGRTGAGETATALMAEYYRQRASAGLLIGESAQISQQGQGFAWAPGLHSAVQIAGWRVVTDAVHAAGGRIFAQLWHAGRMSHVSLQPGRVAPIAPSVVPVPATRLFIDSPGDRTADRRDRFVTASAPRALEAHEIDDIVHDFSRAARHAIDAGFDGVELHGAHGYLIQQFLDPYTNLRDDRYGGSLSNRLRFPCEVARAVVDEIGAERVGLRLAPWRTPEDDTVESVGLALARRMDEIGLIYLHLCETERANCLPLSDAFRRALRMIYRGTLIYTGGYTADRAEAALHEGWADLIGFGRLFISNPDLPHRLWHGLPLASGDRVTYFGGMAAGYTDYPTAREMAVTRDSAYQPSAHSQDSAYSI